MKLYETGFYLLEQHLNRLMDAIKDFQKLNSALFPAEISRQTVIDHLNTKVPQDGSYQRVSYIYCCIKHHVLIEINR